jgi:hypothetical protein
MFGRWAGGSGLVLGRLRGGGCREEVGLPDGREGAFEDGGAGRLQNKNDV